MLHCPRCGQQFSEGTYACPRDLTPLQADTTVATVVVDRLIGRTFEGKYRLDALLGGGGMGVVYKATHLLIDRPVAIKVINQRFVGNESAQKTFRREARAAGRMQHPNAVTVTDFGATDDGYLYIVMELLEGRTLRDVLAHENRMDPARAVSIILQVAAAVGAAHDTGLIHRDLKPANIFIEQRANLPVIVKVLDFGIAKFVVEERDDDFQTLTQAGVVIGTPRYMSPEQCSGVAALTPASDVYSLGIILYEMLTGAVPFNAETTLAIALKQVSEAPRPPTEIVNSIPVELERVVLQALAKNPSDRPRDANELRRELQKVAEMLGLEHAESAYTPTFEELRHAGTESPSGRLVIDLATLRQVHAASEIDSRPPNQPAKALNNTARPLEFDRLSVPLVPAAASRRHAVIATVILLIALLGSVVIAARWWRGGSGNTASADASAAVSPTPTPEASPSPSPTSKGERKPSHRRTAKPSRVRSFIDKALGIFGRKKKGR